MERLHEEHTRSLIVLEHRSDSRGVVGGIGCSGTIESVKRLLFKGLLIPVRVRE
jgi:cysteine synthase